MTANGFVQIALFCAVVVLLVKPFGYYMTRVFKGERTFLSLPLRPLERAIYALSGVKEDEEQDWKSYGLAVLTFSLAGFLALYALQRLQAVLPFNPQHLDAVSPDLAFNTSVSFITNTNWQSYTPETTMSYLTRTVLYVLLPIAIVVGLFFVWQGMPQNLGAYAEATTLEGGKQVIAQGPVASQEVIKILGTNGGGFFNANSAHPYENPNALTNFVQMVLIFSIGAALTNVFGRMVGEERQGWAIFAVMAILDRRRAGQSAGDQPHRRAGSRYHTGRSARGSCGARSPPRRRRSLRRAPESTRHQAGHPNQIARSNAIATSRSMPSATSSSGSSI